MKNQKIKTYKTRMLIEMIKKLFPFVIFLLVAGCMNNDSLPIKEQCSVQDILTPNNDGVNDILEISCLKFYPENEIRIFNQWGDIVYMASPYNNDWNGNLLDSGTYLYTLRLSPDDEEVIRGLLTILRRI